MTHTTYDLSLANAPGMDHDWLLKGYWRAVASGCEMIEHPGLAAQKAVYVTSGTHDGLLYHVTRERCACKGHQYTGRCKHRALAIMEFDVLRPMQRAAETAGDRSAS